MATRNYRPRVEITCKQVIDVTVYHGGIPYLGRLVRPITDTAPFFFSHPTLARIVSLDADSFPSQQEEEEIASFLN